MLSIVGSLLLVLAMGVNDFPRADGQTLVLPEPGQSIVLFQTDEEGSQWSAFAIDFSKQQIMTVQTTTYEGGKVCIVKGMPGSQCAVTRFSKDGKQREALVATLGGTPLPPAPTPTPTPTPTPNPPNPPGPTVPLAGMRVLIIEDESSRGVIPRMQLAALTSSKARTYLKSHNIPARQWDSKLSAANEAKEWQDLMARPHPSLPWVVVAGSSGVAFEGPMPTDEAGLLALLQKYGGP